MTHFELKISCNSAIELADVLEKLGVKTKATTEKPQNTEERSNLVHVVGTVEQHGKAKDKIKVNKKWYKVDSTEHYPLDTKIDTWLEESVYKRRGSE